MSSFMYNLHIQKYVFKISTGHGEACHLLEQPELLSSSLSPVDIACRITYPIKRRGSRSSSVSIVSDYGLDDRTIGVRSPTGAEKFSSSPCVQTGSGAHPATYPMGTGGPFPGGKARPGRDADHSPLSSPEVKYK
jgi:hypothetical protein